MTFLEENKAIVQRGHVPILLPWNEAIGVGVASGDGVTTNLVSGFNYVHFSSPVKEWIKLYGFHINFTPVSVVCAFSNQTERHVWVPFFHTDLASMAGIFTQANPVLPFFRPIDIPPFSRIQIILMNLGTTITDTLITLVGVRMREEIACSS